MRIRIAVPDEHVTPEVINPVLEAVTRLDEHMLRSGQTPTSHELVRGGAVWRPENMGDEHFDHGGTIAERGWGDCDDWAPLHAATLRATGEDPGAKAIVIPSGPSTFHAMVQRGSGELESGERDISVRAGMKPLKHVSGAGDIEVWACDPHDGRIYQGSLAPAVGPLSLHCGAQMSVRGCHIIGQGQLFEARVDMPICGSPLVRVHAYRRRYPHHHHRKRVCGALPYAISVSHLAATPRHALDGALVGAILCGDAAEMTTSLDRYKVLALQSAMAGMSPGEVKEALQAHMISDFLQAEGDPRAHAHALLSELREQGHVQGYVVGDIFGDIAHAASGVVDAVKDVVGKVGPWAGDIIHGVQSIVSLVPGVGTVVSNVLATAETAYDQLSALAHGSPLEGAIHAAYNFALASVPGAAALRPVLDPTVNALIAMAIRKEPVETAVLNNLLNSVPSAPAIGPLNPKSIASTLAHLLVDHLGVKKGSGPMPPKGPPSLPVAIPPQVWAMMQKAHAATPPAIVKIPPKAPAKVIPLRPMTTAPKPLPKPLGVPHAAMPVHPSLPPHPTAAQAPSLAVPRKPGMPPGTTHWHCAPLPGGQWACSWA